MDVNPVSLKASDLLSIKLWIEELENFKPDGKEDGRDGCKLKLPYDVIGMGRKRIVFDIGNGFILKVAITLFGIKSNEKEAEIYKIAPVSLKNHLAAVIDQGHGWIIMKKMDHVVPKTKKNRAKILQLVKKFFENGIEPHDIFIKGIGIHWGNVRINEAGKIIVVDYGNFVISDYSQSQAVSKESREEE